jgi:very-short-patch-repair endonuclease
VDVIFLTIAHKRVAAGAFFSVRPFLQHLFESDGVLSRRCHPELDRVLDGLLYRREIEAVLPGVYTLPGLGVMPQIRIAALQLYEPDAIFLEHAAARLTFWPALPVAVVAAAVPRTRTLERQGFRLVRRHIPIGLVREVAGRRMTVPALTALDLGADAIDFALREGAVTLAEMQDAVDTISRHRGNSARRLVLQESSDEPWSAAERQLHRLLRAAGITGWVGNLPLIIGESLYVIDVAFSAIKLAIEVDGRHYHGAANFEIDRWRQNAIALDGWRILRFTWTMIDCYPERVVAAIEQALARWG